MIELNEVSYTYSGIPALNNITLRIDKGEAVALLGPNGSGKSTLLKLINGILAPSKGSYLYDGEAVTEHSMKDTAFSKRLHRRIGFVFQNSDTQLFCPEVYDEIAFGPRQMGLEESEVEQRVQDCLKLLGIETLRNRQPYHLSGGEKRRVAIACVLAMNPEVLVLDEPMNGLDPRTQRSLVEVLVKLNQAGKTLITSTHNLELVQEISRRAILFDESHRIIADAETEVLLLNTELLKQVNLVDDFYHRHEDRHHSHFHTHTY